MLVFTRERILSATLELSALSDLYQRKDPDYFPKAVGWLKALEETLQSLRHPLVGFVAAERGRLLAAGDGYADPGVDATKRSARHRQRATAALVLVAVEQRLHTAVARLDERIEAVMDKMAQLLAVASNSAPIPLAHPRENRDVWLNRVWEGLPRQPETAGMRGYLEASLTQNDREHLLATVLERLLAARGPAEPEKRERGGRTRRQR